MRLLVTGARGMLGQDLVALFTERGHEVIGTDYDSLDITDPLACATIASGDLGHLDWVVNCAAYTAVDKAESEPEKAFALNAFAVGYLARAAGMAKARFLQVSTDFVFDGRSSEPYSEDDKPNPLGVYGQSKRDGEEAALAACPGAIVARTAWLYGTYGNSFPRTMIRAHESGRSLRVVADQIGCPTYTKDLARVLAGLMESGAPGGVYHATGPDAMSWCDFARLVLKLWTGKEIPVEAIATEEWPTPAERPRYSVLSFTKCSDLGIPPMRRVDEALSEFLSELRTQGTL